MQSFIENYILYFAWTLALASTLGSLFFSEVLHFAPCVLCWDQRICMYPLVIILTVGILKKDKQLFLYVLPLSLVGLVVSIFHNLLYYKILPESEAPCTFGVSCTTRFIEIFGFITIPFLSFTGFLLITACMLLYRRYNNQK